MTALHALALLGALALPVQAPPAPLGYIESFAAAWAAVESGELDSARAHYARCLALRPESATCAYHLACLEARAGDPDAALLWLDRALAWGWTDAPVLAWEPDLEPLREAGLLAPRLASIEAPSTSSDRAARLSWSVRTAFPEFSADGSRLVTGRNGDAYLWDVSRGELVAVLPGVDGGIASSALSPDGRNVVTTHGASARVWRASDGGLSRSLEGTSPWQGRIRFSGDGARVLISGGSPKQVARVWDLATGALLFDDVPGGSCVLLDANGARAISSQGIYSLEQGRWIVEQPLAGRHPPVLAVSSDGSRAFVPCHGKGGLRVFDLLSGEELYRIGSRYVNCIDAAFLGASNEIVLASRDHGLELYRDDGTALPLGDAGDVWGFAGISSDGRLLLTTGSAGRLWDLERGDVRFEIANSSLTGIGIAALSRDGARIAWSEDWEHARILETDEGRRLLELRGRAGPRDPQVSPTEPVGAWPCVDGSVRELDVATGALASVTALQSAAWATTYSADGAWRADSSLDGVITLRDLRSRGAIELPVRMPQPIGGPEVMLSPDGALVVALGRYTGRLVVWQRAQGSEPWSPGPDERIHLARVSADGRLLVTADISGMLRVRDAVSGAPVAQKHLRDGIAALDLSPDGRSVATGSTEGIARLWSFFEPGEPRELDHGQDIFGDRLCACFVAFTPDGSRLLTSTSSWHSVRSWDANTGTHQWTHDFRGGNGCTPRVVSASPDGSRIWVDGCIPSEYVVLDAAGQAIASLAEHWPRDQVLHASTQTLLAVSDGAACAIDAETFRVRWKRVELWDGDWLRSVPSMHCEGSAGAMQKVHVVREDGSLPLACYAERLVDPRRIRAWLAGVDVATPELPPPPRVESASVREVADVGSSLRATAIDEGGLRGFEVRIGGALVEPDVVLAATTLGQRGTRATLELPLDGEGEVEVRALGRSNVLSRAARPR